ncbi:SPOR domain-containing protein [Prevotella sp. E9-3]|uniref:SPOR domain-containing protein n=1 Tax=Prevotella sp. E9-3 TaxID=2913621 RepID=UPI001ED9D31B|nr:SPOR domain-containing protein [Prevotella sp. E9-3]UKK47818.1 SPOR domain-containing protein [Prevotella sp. E9-3]
MKKYMILCAGLCLAMVFTGCKSKESAYKQAYEKAKAAESAQAPAEVIETQVATETPTVTPVQTRPVTQTTVVDNVDNISVREERVSVVSGTGLRNFSVVVGSFSVIANAEGLQQRLKNAGYAAQIVKNVDRNMYRVVASTFDDKASAAQSRDQLRGTYPDAWLLYNVK